MNRLVSTAALVLLSISASHAEQSIRVYRSDDTLLRLGSFTFSGGKTVSMTVGIGSGAFRGDNDPANVFWSIGDRGPNMTCGDMKKIAGRAIDACKTTKNARIFLTPFYTPSIYQVMLLADGTFRVTDVITVKDKDGRPVSSMPNPLRTATTDIPFDGNGQPLKQDAGGLDMEGIVHLADGSFWIGEENAPSIVHLRADGRIIARYVPAGTEQEFASANYKVVGGLPAILAKRFANRGIEGLGISPGEKYLYFMLQNPLANPDSAAYAKARNTRLFKVERDSMKIVAEYVYQLDDPMTFRRDPSDKQNAPRISEIMGIGIDRLVIDERTEETTKLYEIDLAAATNIIGAKWDDVATSPSLEKIDLSQEKIIPLKKTLRFDTADHKEIVGKTEGMAILEDGSLMIVNDDDFGIFGGHTQIVTVTDTGITRQRD